jgi:exosortase/archaeosortase family protein
VRAVSVAHTLSCRPVRLGATEWLALHAIALWPHGAYLVRRAIDGSDAPLGLLALGAVAALVAWHRHSLRLTPRLGWLTASMVCALVANGAWWAGVPALLASLLAALSLVCALLAWWPTAQPRAPLAGLVVLALPWIASLQFYLGFPLRVLTAQLSAWGLQWAGYDAARDGASMVVNGQLVIVDAPCSGVQMAWLAYFTACAAAAATGQRDRVFVRRAAGVGAIVLAGNVVRNSLLVALEARPSGLSAAAHEAIGLAVLGTVCIAVLALMQRREASHA